MDEKRRQVKLQMEREGLTIADWARRHGFADQVVRDVLTGKNKARFGNGHRIAILLGLKEEVTDPKLSNGVVSDRRSAA